EGPSLVRGLRHPAERPDPRGQLRRRPGDPGRPARSSDRVATEDRNRRELLPGDQLRPARQKGVDVMRVALMSLVAVLLTLPATADDPPKKLTPEERKDLEARLAESANSGQKHYQAGRMADAATAYTKALETARTLYPKADFPNGHEDLAFLL